MILSLYSYNFEKKINNPSSMNHFMIIRFNLLKKNFLKTFYFIIKSNLLNYLNYFIVD